MTYPDMPAARADHHHQQHDGHPQQQPLRFPQRRHFPTTRQPDDSAILEDINFGSEDLLTDLGSRRKSDTSKGVRYQSGSGNIDNVVVMPPQYVERSSVVISDSGNQTASTSSATCSSHAIGFRSFCENDIEPIAKVKCVLVGDGAVGKTSLIVSYTTNGYPSEYVPTAFDNYSVEVTVDCKPVRLQLCDTPGQDDFDTLRILCYPDTDVFLLCFSVVSPTSFQNIKDKWASEISQYAPKTPVILVGTQCDLRDDVKVLIALNQYGEKPVSELEALDCCKKIGALTYIESSSLTQKNLKDVFDTVILAALNWDGYRKKLCRKESKRYSKRRKKFSNAKSDDKEFISETDQSRPKKHGWRKYLCMS